VNYISHFVNKKCEKYFTFSKLFCKISDMKDMNGLTVSEMAEKLGLDPHTVAVRLNRAGIKPNSKEALYDESALEAIKNVQMGRPPKAKPEAPVASKPKKAKK
jgi:hypothetical protein